jgi:hypothetical protein
MPELALVFLGIGINGLGFANDIQQLHEHMLTPHIARVGSYVVPWPLYICETSQVLFSHPL